MRDGVHIQIQRPKAPGERPICHVEIGSEHAGRHVTFSLVRKVAVKDNRAVNRDENLFEHGFQARAGSTESFELPSTESQVYAYRGPHMSIELLCRVVVDDGFIFDTTVEEAFHHDPFRRPGAGSCASDLESPEDQYDFFHNLTALPPGRRAVAGGIAILGGGGLATFCFLSLHDTLVSRGSQIFFTYSDGPPPVILGIFAGIFGALILYFLLKYLLGGYLDLSPAPMAATASGTIGREDTVAPGDLFEATTHTDLNGLQVRVIACNMEKGQYRRGSGTNTRTVSFSKPTRGVLLFEQFMGFLKAGTEIHRALRDPIDLKPMFDGLYPPQMVGANHGMDLHVEVQLIHPNLVDRELILSADLFRWEDFLDDGESS